MKKTILISLLTVASVTTLASASAYASGGKKPASSNAKAAEAFQQNYPQIKQVNWSVVEKQHMASFMIADRSVRCIFSKTGTLISTFVTYPAQYLPFEVQTSLNKHYREYVPQTVTEHISRNEHAYYILLKDMQGPVIKWLRVRTDGNGANISVIQLLHQTL